MRELDVALLDHAGIAQAARIIETDTGADMPWPTIDDTGNSGHLLAELSAAATNVDPTIAAVTFGSWLYTSDIVLIPNQLIQDSAFNIETEIARLLGVRLGRILNTDGTLGSGSSKPRGIVTALMADTTPVVPVAAAALSYLDLVEVMHAVDPAYRNQPKVAWMFHDQILMALKQMLDDANRPIWAGGIAVREPDTILGKPYFINQAMDSTIAEDKETVIFGDFSKYIIRRVLNPILIRLNERYAEYYQTGFVMFDRWDSDLVNGAADPLAIITHNLV
jgi:HK97 family phage major capsid protein